MPTRQEYAEVLENKIEGLETGKNGEKDAGAVGGGQAGEGDTDLRTTKKSEESS